MIRTYKLKIWFFYQNIMLVFGYVGLIGVLIKFNISKSLFEIWYLSV